MAYTRVRLSKIIFPLYNVTNRLSVRNLTVKDQIEHIAQEINHDLP